MINIIKGSSEVTAVSLWGALSIYGDVREIMPCSIAVHQTALKASDEFKAKATLSLLYFAKPVDRLIQALATPIFYLMSYFKTVAEGYHSDNYLLKSFAVIGTLAVPIAVPALLLISAGYALCPLINGLYQIIVPYQTLYAVTKGKEASREFFDYYNTISNNKIVASPPAQTLNGLMSAYPLQPHEETLYALAIAAAEVVINPNFTLSMNSPLALVRPIVRILSAC